MRVQPLELVALTCGRQLARARGDDDRRERVEGEHGAGRDGLLRRPCGIDDPEGVAVDQAERTTHRAEHPREPQDQGPCHVLRRDGSRESARQLLHGLGREVGVLGEMSAGRRLLSPRAGAPSSRRGRSARRRTARASGGAPPATACPGPARRPLDRASTRLPSIRRPAPADPVGSLGTSRRPPPLRRSVRMSRFRARRGSRRGAAPGRRDRALPRSPIDRPRLVSPSPGPGGSAGT